MAYVTLVVPLTERRADERYPEGLKV